MTIKKVSYTRKPYRDNYILLYLPQKIRADGKEKALNLTTLREISGGLFDTFDGNIEEEFGSNTSHGWVLVSKNVIPNSGKKSYRDQKDGRGTGSFHMPQAVEAVAANLMVFAITKEPLYGVHPLTYTRCEEKVKQNPVLVGGFGPQGLMVISFDLDLEAIGVAPIWKF